MVNDFVCARFVKCVFDMAYQNVPVEISTAVSILYIFLNWVRYGDGVFLSLLDLGRTFLLRFFDSR